MPDTNVPKKPPPRKPADPDDVRMSFGDHLEELRTRLIRALIGVGVGIAISAIFARRVLAIIYHPLQVVLAKYGLPPQLYTLHPGEGFTTWMKVALIGGLLLSCGWVIHQGWQFVAVGLYRHERRFVQRVAPVSVGLFVLGVVFMYLVVLPLALEFFVTFNLDYGPPDVARRSETTASAPTPASLPALPLLENDPVDPPLGSMWFNTTRGTFSIRTQQGIRTLFLNLRQGQSAVTPLFSLEFYLAFFTGLALAFGVSFQLPVVVIALAWLDLVPVETMTRGRRYIIFVIVIAAAILTPTTDLISMALLAVPMIGLFEAGLFAARWLTRLRQSRRGEAETQSGAE